MVIEKSEDWNEFFTDELDDQKYISYNVVNDGTVADYHRKILVIVQRELLRQQAESNLKRFAEIGLIPAGG